MRFKTYSVFESELQEKKKTANSPDWVDSDAPDAEGRFKKLGIKDLAAWLIKTRKKDLKRITGSLNQQIVFNRNEDPAYAEKMEKVREEVYRQLGRKDLLEDFSAVGVAPEGNVSGMGPVVGPNAGSEGSGDVWDSTGKKKKKKKKLTESLNDESLDLDLDQIQKKYPNAKITLTPNDKFKDAFNARVDIITQGGEIEYLGALRGPASKEDALEFFNNILSREYDKFF